MSGLSQLQGRRVLVIGRSPGVNRSVVEPLVALGIDAQGTTQPEHAGELFNAKDFERIVFGRGVLGTLSDQLKRDFVRQNPDVRFVDAIAPVAVKQTLTSLTRSPVRLVSDFRVISEDMVDRILATVLTACHVTLTTYRATRGTGLAEDVLADLDVEPGAFEEQIDSGRLAHANSLLLTVDEQEYHLHAFLTRR